MLFNGLTHVGQKKIYVRIMRLMFLLHSQSLHFLHLLLSAFSRQSRTSALNGWLKMWDLTTWHQIAGLDLWPVHIYNADSTQLNCCRGSLTNSWVESHWDRRCELGIRLSKRI